MDVITSDMKRKTVLITGASGGIGAAVSEYFAQAGARVIMHYNNDEEGAQDKLGNLVGDGHFAVKADLSSRDSIDQMMNEIFSKVTAIDVLINNAGIYDEHKIFTCGKEEWNRAWDSIMNVNLMGPVYLSYLIINRMADRGGGKVINITSRGAFRGEPSAPAYAASKAALNAFSQSMAKEVAPQNVFVYAIAPGWVDTKMAASSLQGPEGDSVRSQSPLNRVARPEEIAHTALFLACEGSEFLTGGIIDINGASYLRV